MEKKVARPQNFRKRQTVLMKYFHIFASSHEIFHVTADLCASRFTEGEKMSNIRLQNENFKLGSYDDDITLTVNIPLCVSVA